MTFIGYGMLASVPLLAFAGRWDVAALLIVAERMGKGIRSPAKDAILSHAASNIGQGFGFGIHEAFDQIGAVAGPLVFSAVFLAGGGGIEAYRLGFLLLGIPLVLLVATLLCARARVPEPADLERIPIEGGLPDTGGLPRVFLPYSVFTALTMAGFVAFPLIAYHFVGRAIVPESVVPLLYALAMGVDAAVALIAGRAYDRAGVIALAAVPLVNLLIPVFAFWFTSFQAIAMGAAVIAAALWGAAMGIQETVLRAAIADCTHIQRRGVAYGLFNTVYGAGWFAGSVLIGLLYDAGLVPVIVGITAALQLAAVPAFVRVRREFAQLPWGDRAAADDAGRT